jgi:hypothetical protein
MSGAASLWLLLVLSTGLESGTCRHVLPPESAEQISDAISMAEGNDSKITVHHIKIRSRSIVLQISEEGERSLVTMERPGDSALSEGWRFFAPTTTSNASKESFEPLLRSFDRGLDEDPWICVDDDDRSIDSTPSAPLSTSSTWSPALAFLYVAYSSHWLLLLAFILLLLGTRSGRGL